MNNKPKKKTLLKLLIILTALVIVIPALARAWVHSSARGRLYSVASVPHHRVALILGAGVRPNGELSPLLRDRVEMGIALYKAGKAEKLLMSGDNRVSHYNEPERMRKYAIAHGVPAADVICDYAGRRTFDSMYRAKHIFGVNRLIIVSQAFHLDRSIFLSKRVGLDAYGVAADSPIRLRDALREPTACVLAMIDAYVRQPRPVMGEKQGI